MKPKPKIEVWPEFMDEDPAFSRSYELKAYEEELSKYKSHIDSLEGYDSDYYGELFSCGISLREESAALEVAGFPTDDDEALWDELFDPTNPAKRTAEFVEEYQYYSMLRTTQIGRNSAQKVAAQLADRAVMKMRGAFKKKWRAENRVTKEPKRPRHPKAQTRNPEWDAWKPPPPLLRFKLKATVVLTTPTLLVCLAAYPSPGGPSAPSL